MKGYRLCDILKLLFFFIHTKIFWGPAKLIRLPVLVRNRKNIFFSEGFICGVNCRFNPGPNGLLKIGKNCVFGDQCQIEAMKEVIIGDDVLVASKVYIGDSNHGVYSGCNQSNPSTSPNNRIVSAKSISIGNKVWIGNAVTILGGVSIGCGTIIGAGAVVVSDIPNNSIAVGCPARVIKRYNEKTGTWDSV